MKYSELEEKVIEMGCDDAIVLDKMFGPLVFHALRITPIFEDCTWLIEREINGQYVEWCRIPGQSEVDKIVYDLIDSK